MNPVTFTLNGKSVSVQKDPLIRLLDVLREDLKLTAVKEGCGEGECGACSVLKDGEIVNSCMVPMGTVQGCEIVTPEGLRESERGKCIIDAFGESGAVQCGFCTPGMLMAAEALLDRNPDPDEAEVREGLSGNLCRCTGYDMIVRGVLLAAEKGRGLW
jgi:carbon-monoxide dehydrogenase small subunit